jgi:hypothetical protein
MQRPTTNLLPVRLHVSLFSPLALAIIARFTAQFSRNPCTAVAVMLGRKIKYRSVIAALVLDPPPVHATDNAPINNHSLLQRCVPRAHDGLPKILKAVFQVKVEKLVAVLVLRRLTAFLYLVQSLEFRFERCLEHTCMHRQN